MPLFDDYLPYQQTAYRPRNFSGNWWSKTKLALSGSNTDGSSNHWGDIANVALPVVLEIVGDYYSGGAAAGLGAAVGNLANKGLDAWGDNILDGTDTQINYRQVSARQQKDDAIFSLLSNVAGSIASSIGKNQTSQKKLDKLLGKENGYMDSIVNPAGAQPQNSISDIKWLDDKKSSFSSTLPYNMFSQMAKNGGMIVPYLYFAGGGMPRQTDRFGMYYRDGPTKVYTNDPGLIDQNAFPNQHADAPDTPQASAGNLGIKDRIALAEGSLRKTNPYGERNSVGPGHFGKYQLEPRLISRFAPGLSIDQFLSSPNAQEAAMDRLLGQYDAEIKNIRRQTSTDWDQDSLRLLTHFQGSPAAIRALNNPALLHKSTKYNPSIMDYVKKRSYGIYHQNGGQPVPYLFFQSGSEVSVGDFSPSDIMAIRERYDLDAGETVSNTNTELIVLAGLRGELPVPSSKFAGLPGASYLAGFINQFSPIGRTSGGDYKVRGQGRAYSVASASFDRGDLGLERYHKGKRVQEGLPFVSNEPKRRSRLPIVPFVYFTSGGQTCNPQGHGGSLAKKWVPLGFR